MNALYRLWRMPLRFALLLVLPLQLVMVWVLHLGWTQYSRNRSFGDAAASLPFDLDQLRYFTKNELDRSISRTLATDPTTTQGLETIELTIDRRHVASLNANLPDSGRTTYYPAELTVDGERHPIKARYMGDNHWHWLYPQKSWKVKAKKGDPIRNRASFNLKNPPTVATVEDIIANNLAKDFGLISPEVTPVKLFVNGAYSGVHLWWDIADESLLRRYQRMPGSIYSGDGAPPGPDGVSMLFANTDRWEKASARNAEQAQDRADIEALIAAVNNPDPAAFRGFIDQHFDIEKYAQFVALDRLLGGQHHDYTHNHKLYFDPYKGRFEPIEWDFAFWILHLRLPGIDQTLNPLLMRLRQQPDIELRILRAMHAQLQKITPTAMAALLDAEARRLDQPLMSDGFRDWRDHRSLRALRLGTVHSAFFSRDEFLAELERMNSSYERRHAWLVQRLREAGIEATQPPADQSLSRLVLRSTGLVAQHLTGIRVATNARKVSVVQDRNDNGQIDDGEPVVGSADASAGHATVQLDEMIYPGLAVEPFVWPYKMNNGTVALKPSSLNYSYILVADGGQMGQIEATATNAITGDPVEVRWIDSLPPTQPVYSTHPWQAALPTAPHTVEFGPGEVRLEENRSFGPEVTVVFHPGTTVRLAANVSIEMLGKVMAVGTAAEPIRFEPIEPEQPWGVFALHGLATSGSRFAYCSWQDGSASKLRMVLRTGMVSIIETSDIEMLSCFVGRNHVGDDALHWGYVEGGEIRDCEFRGARSDAFDIDISHDLRIVDCRFFNSGNDSIDLMTAAVEVRGCSFTDAGDKGTSVGEGSSLSLFDSRFERCVTGIEIKDSSVAKVDDKTRFLQCKTAVNLYRKNPRYSLGGTLEAGDLWTSGCESTIKADQRSTVKIGTLHEHISH